MGALGKHFFAEPTAGPLGIRPHGDFQLWSGVLEAGGYDVIVEPFTDREIQGAVLRAAASFEERRQNEMGNE